MGSEKVKNVRIFFNIFKNLPLCGLQWPQPRRSCPPGPAAPARQSPTNPPRIGLSGHLEMGDMLGLLQVTSNPKRTKRMSCWGSECCRPEKPWPDGQEIDLRRKINLKRAMIQMGIGQDTCLGPRFCFAKNTTSTRCQCTLYFHTRTILIDTSQVLFLALSLRLLTTCCLLEEVDNQDLTLQGEAALPPFKYAFLSFHVSKIFANLFKSEEGDNQLV